MLIDVGLDWIAPETQEAHSPSPAHPASIPSHLLCSSHCCHPSSFPHCSISRRHLPQLKTFRDPSLPERYAAPSCVPAYSARLSSRCILPSVKGLISRQRLDARVPVGPNDDDLLRSMATIHLIQRRPRRPRGISVLPRPRKHTRSRRRPRSNMDTASDHAEDHREYDEPENHCDGDCNPRLPVIVCHAVVENVVPDVPLLEGVEERGARKA